MHIVARANAEHGEQFGCLHPLYQGGNRGMARSGEEMARGELPPVLVFNKPREDPIADVCWKVLENPTPRSSACR